MTPRRTDVDRAAAVRRALLELVAEQGLHGTAMAAVARRAGVAAGTIYVHYADRDALILATYREVKHDLGVAATSLWDADAPPRERFLGAWHRVYEHLLVHPERASFLLQLDASPYARLANPAGDGLDGDAGDDPAPGVWTAAADDLGDVLIDVPVDILYQLAFGPAVALAARAALDSPVADATLDAVARACWRAVASPLC